MTTAPIPDMLVLRIQNDSAVAVSILMKHGPTAHTHSSCGNTVGGGTEGV